MTPGQVSKFVDKLCALSKADDHMTEARRLEHEARPRCGTCRNWMRKPACPREAKGEKPSMIGAACSAYAAEDHVERRLSLAARHREKALAALSSERYGGPCN